MSTYLDRAKQFLGTLAVKPPGDEEPTDESEVLPPPANLSEGSTGLILTTDPPVDAVEQELWEERLAIVESDAEPPLADAYPLFLPLRTPEPIPAEDGVFVVGDLCVGCWENGKISHLYRIRDDVWACRKCLR